MSVCFQPDKPTLIPGVLQGLSDLIDATGDGQFGKSLMAVLAASCGARHCKLFQVTKQTLSPVAAASLNGTDYAQQQFSRYLDHAYWRGDSFMAETMGSIGSNSVSLANIGTSSMRDVEVRDNIYVSSRIGERILLCGRTPRTEFGLSILRDEVQGYATVHELSRVNDISGMLLSIVDKHIALLKAQSNSANALTSLSYIEEMLSQAAAALPRRQVQVCARILNGVSTTGIALDLGLGEETVITHRKRAYQTLHVGNQRDLLSWYFRWLNGSGSEASRQ